MAQDTPGEDRACSEREAQAGAAKSGAWPPSDSPLTERVVPVGDLEVRQDYRVYDRNGRWLEGEYQQACRDHPDLLEFRFSEFSIQIGRASVAKIVELAS